MVVAEEAGTADPDLGRAIMDGLWAAYEKVGDSIKGDIVYLAGEIGARADKEILLSLSLKENNAGPEIVEAVHEALATLEERGE